MGKDRKLKKGRQEEDFGEVEVDIDSLNSEESSTTSKKKKSKKNDDDKTTDLLQKVQSLSLEDLNNQGSKPLNKKEGKKNKARAEKNRSDDEAEIFDNKFDKQIKKSNKKKTDDDDDNKIDNVKLSKKKGKKKQDESDDDEIQSKYVKGKKNKTKIDISDEEIENQDQSEEKIEQKKHRGKIAKPERSDDDDDETILVKDNKANKKSKKGKSNLIDDDELIETNVKVARKQKGRKIKDEISDDDSELVVNIARTKKKDDHTKKIRESNIEIDNESVATKKRSLKSKSVFELLDVEDDDIDLDYEDDSKSDDFNKVKSKPEIKKQSLEEQDSTIAGKIKDDKLGKKSKKKERKKKDDDDDEVEKMLEELALEIEGKKPAAEKQKEGTPESMEQDSKAEESERSTKKKKKKKTEVPENQLEKLESQLDIEKEDHTVKTAAQKKKEKKEKEKQKKLSQKAQERKKNDVEESEVATAIKLASDNDIENAVVAEEEKDDADDDDGKQKKKKKKKGEEEKKDKKRPGRKQILAMQEALKKLKEEEERIKLEEEEKQRAAEEAERKRQEQLRLEQERKERKKQKEKEKRERLKAEGKILTKSQKQSRARMEATLSALRLQGVEVPQIGEKRERPPRLGDKKKYFKKKPSEAQPEQKAAIPEETSLPQVKVEIISQSENKLKEDNITEEKIKESWEDKDDVKDAWDESSEDEDEDEEGEKEVHPQAKDKITQEIIVKKDESEESDEDDDDDDDDDDPEKDDDDDEDQSTDESDDDKNKQEKIKERVQERIQRRREEAERKRTVDKLRSPVVCVLGHVDTGKTKILDKIRRTHVQDNEAGGITQQIGATMVPQEALKEQCKMVKNFPDIEVKLPGLLIIDTPGHESFSNLRSRGSSLCDIAILVVDIMHGLEPQTIESINLLKQKKTPFVVALNKIDRLYDWKSNKNKDIQDIIKSQARNTKLEFDERVREIVVQFAEQGLNAALSYENKDARTYISMVPTSAFTGEGMGNLMALIVELSQTMMAKRLAFSEELQATVLEVKAISGLGTTIDVILVNGRLKEGDTIVVAGQEGPVVTQIRSLLMPEPLKELRVKNPYNDYREVEGAQGVKIAGKDLEKAIAGLQLLVAYHPDEVEILKEEVANSLRDAINSIKLAERGVYVQASTLGSLEALLEFLRTSKIPYSGVRIGPVVKKDVMKASIMLEHETQYAVILAFDVKVERDAEELAESLGVKIFQANIIYHLFDRFTAYQEELHQKKRDEYKHIAVFPCKLRILPQYIFNSRDPIVIGVSVEAGVVREGTPICVPSREFLDIGTVTTLELNHKSIETARKGQEICIKIEPHSGESPKMFGRHFDETDLLVSKITRQSIDACKNYFRDDLQKSDWQLMVELKKMFQIL